MIETVAVSLSAPSFSLLLHEVNKSINGQEGFLIGEIVEKESRSITDNDQEQINVSRQIKINSVIPCPRTGYFYDKGGRIEETIVKRLLGSEFMNVVGWYSYKTVNGLRVSFREKLITSQLSKIVVLVPDLFSLCLLATESSENSSTHTYQQTFLRYNHGRYDPLPLHISNLSDPNNSYKSAEPSSEIFKLIVKQLRLDPKKSQGVTCIQKIQTGLRQHVDKVITDLVPIEKKLYDLEKEVEALKVAQQVKQMQRFREKCNAKNASAAEIPNEIEYEESSHDPLEISPIRETNSQVKGRSIFDTPKSGSKSQEKGSKINAQTTNEETPDVENPWIPDVKNPWTKNKTVSEFPERDTSSNAKHNNSLDFPELDSAKGVRKGTSAAQNTRGRGRGKKINLDNVNNDKRPKLKRELSK